MRYCRLANDDSLQSIVEVGEHWCIYMPIQYSTDDYELWSHRARSEFCEVSFNFTVLDKDDARLVQRLGQMEADRISGLRYQIKEKKLKLADLQKGIDAMEAKL